MLSAARWSARRSVRSGRPKDVVQRAAGEVVVDDERAHVRRARDRRGVPELVPDATHHCWRARASLPLRCRSARAAASSLRSEERPAPGPEVLCRVLGAEVLGDVLVQVGDVSATRSSSRSNRKSREPSGRSRSAVIAVRERRVRDAPPHELAVLCAEAERDLVARYGDVALAESCHAVRTCAPHVPLRADAEPSLVHHADRRARTPTRARRVRAASAVRSGAGAWAVLGRSRAAARTLPAPAPLGSCRGSGTACGRRSRHRSPAGGHGDSARSRHRSRPEEWRAQRYARAAPRR